MVSLIRDIQYGIRLLIKSPGFTFAAGCSLALGIGANTAIFSIVSAVLLQEPPVQDPDRLVELYSGDEDFLYGPSAYPDYVDFRDQNEVFSGLIAHSTVPLSYTADERTEPILGEIVSGDYFQVLGIRAAHGRTLLPEDDVTPGAHPVAVLNHGFWQRRFTADPQMVGKTVKLNGHQFTVVGIAPEEFKGLMPGLSAQIWVPMMMADQVKPDKPGRLALRDSHWISVKGRLKPGVTLEQAQAQAEIIGERLVQEYPDSNEGQQISLLSANRVAIHPMVDQALFGAAGLLLIVTALVLLIASANIANLLLVRASARRREIAIRLAVGAGRGQMIRQLLIESLLLALAGGAAGLLVAYWTVRSVVAFKPPVAVPIFLDLGLDSRVLWFTLVLSLLTGLICGLAPALKSTRPGLVAELKDEQTTLARAYRRFGLRNLLVIGQVAVSSLLLICAGLFIRSLQNAHAVDPGFTTRKAVIATLQPDLAGYDETRGRAFFQQLVERLEALPGVRAVTLTDWLPLSLGFKTEDVFIEGHEMAADDDGEEIDAATIGPNYFKTLGISLLRGRDFSPQDRDSTTGVTIVNETMVHRFWPAVDPIGKRLSIAGPGGPYLEVVGVASDGKYRSLGEDPRPYLYVPWSQHYATLLLKLVVQTAGEPAESMAAVRREILDLDANLPILELQTIEEHLDATLFPVRMGALLLAAFGLLGLLLAAVGLYGVVAYSVSRRTREMGIRTALGAQRLDVLRLVLGEGLTLFAVGLALGLMAALAATRLLSGLLYGISATDPVTFIGVVLVLGGIAFAANLIPAYQMIRADPMAALRYQ